VQNAGSRWKSEYWVITQAGLGNPDEGRRRRGMDILVVIGEKGPWLTQPWAVDPMLGHPLLCP
jgi:hypothetical protein